MREPTGERLAVNGRSVYVERSGRGTGQVVFEAGAGCGRTMWDRVVPLLADTARLVTYDRAGRALTRPTTTAAGIDAMADDLVALTGDAAPGEVVLVAHSMGGLVARRAVEHLGGRVRGLLLVDALPETSPVYDTWDRTTARVDRVLALTGPLCRWRPLARLFSANLRHLFATDTYEAMLREDFTPAGTAQTRSELRAVAAAIPQFRARAPRAPACPTIVLSAARAARGRERQHAAIVEHQRRYAEGLPDGRFETVESGHLVPAERPDLVAARIRDLLGAA